MRIIDQVNDYLLNPHVISDRARFSHYPSEASVISRLDGNIIGKCHRATWYSWKRLPVSNPIDARGQWTFDFGKKLEEMYVEYTKRIGIWAGNNVHFYDTIHNISGETDLFIFGEQDKDIADDPIGENFPLPIIGIEIKSAYGYGFQNNVKKFPKIENLLQCAIYMTHFEMNEWILIYHSRDTMENVEYTITKGKDEQGTYLIINEIPCKIFYVEDIYKRYEQLGEYVIKNEEPPRDYTYGYIPEQSKIRNEIGQLSDSAYRAVKNGKKTDSDWQCLYCNYLNHCWAEKRGIIGDKADEDKNANE